MLVYPVFLGLQLVFTIGLALLLATWTAFFRDIRHFLEIVLAALFWLTPIVYQPEQIPARLRPLLQFAPMTPFVTAYHDIFFQGRWPDAPVWLLAVAYAAVSAVLGLKVLLGREDLFSEVL